MKYPWLIMHKSMMLCMLIFLVCSANNCNRVSSYDTLGAYEAHTSTPYNPSLPPHFPPLKMPDDNPMTMERVKLGQKLYYDPILHKNRSMACGSCHIQDWSFTTFDKVLPHVNLGWNRFFLWNGKIEGSLEDAMLYEVESFMQTEISHLNQDKHYPRLFNEAFGTDIITSKEIAYALAQFVRTMISGNSKYDQYARGEIELTPAETRGYTIFFSEKGGCFHCHPEPLFTDNRFHNNGLDNSIGGSNRDRYEVTRNRADRGKFKTPTLRNSELTSPFMHDGRFQTLEEVIDFYSTGVKSSETIDPLMKNVEKGGLQLTEQEKKDLIAFLKILTDSSFINNERLSPPKGSQHLVRWPVSGHSRI
jgi:cytochrome c peroxidase